MSTLPNKPSQLIKLALTDLETVEKNPRYEIDMERWHEPWIERMDSDGHREYICHVCLAGAVLANTFKEDYHKNFDPYHFSPEVKTKLIAIDYLRQGEIEDAFDRLQLELPQSMMRSIDIRDYHANKDGFKVDMLALATNLEEYNL